MRAHFGLPSVQNEEAEGKPPINVKFEIPYFTVSGIQVSRILFADMADKIGILTCSFWFGLTKLTLL